MAEYLCKSTLQTKLEKMKGAVIKFPETINYL